MGFFSRLFSGMQRTKKSFSEKLKYVVSVIAQIKGITEEEVERITWENAKKLYQM